VLNKALLVAALLAGCGSPSHPPQSFAGLTRVSGLSPFAPGCAPAGQQGTNFPNAEVEPFLAIDPTNAKHLIGVWQQDRWSNGGSNGLGSAVSIDGGRTWNTGFAHFTICSGGTAANRADYDRASDPWVTFGADGTPHQIGFAFDALTTRQAMLAVRSLDGGRTWTEPIPLIQDSAAGINDDKESITADPADGHYVYAVWDRLDSTNPASLTGPAYFARTTDFGATWETARNIYDPGFNSQTIGNQIVVLPDGTLIDLFTILRQINQIGSIARAAVLRSADKGLTWSPQPVIIADEQSQGVADPKTHAGVRTGDIVPEIAVDRASGALYVVWEDSRFTGGTRDGIVLSKSTDKGLNWSAPVRVNGVLTTQAFTPAIAVAAGGKIGVTYYDLRNDNPGDNSQLLATAWLAVSSDFGATFQESALGGPFDIRTAAQTADGYFIGDYQGLVASGAEFLPFFVLTNSGNTSNRSDVFFHPPGGVAAVFASEANAFDVPRRQRTGLRRAF
jgi:hypothetical protein